MNLWDVAGGRLLRELRAELALVNAVAFSPDGATLAAGTVDLADGGGPNAVVLWNVADGEVLCRLGGKGQEEVIVTSVAFSPDGRLLAYGDIKNQVHLYEVATRHEVCRFRGHTDQVLKVAFSPAGRTLASAGGDTTVLVWDVLGLTPGAGLPAGRVSAARLERLWEALDGRDGRAAFQAVGELVHADAASFLAGRLRPVAAVPPERIAAQVAALDSNDFATRKKAREQLARIGEQAAPALRKALAGAPSAEVKRRARELLRELQAKGAPLGRLREVRALMALELMGTPAARQVLRGLAAGAPGAWRTEQANAALGRLEEHGAENSRPTSPGNPTPLANGRVARPGVP